MSELNLNKIFSKQLNKHGLSVVSLPSDLIQWQQFIARINNHYQDIDQELYILERSSQIASRESIDLNKKLEDAQRLANIGRWHYNILKNKVFSSKEFYSFFGLEQNFQALTYEQVENNVHYNDKKQFANMITKSVENIVDAECEIRLIMPNKSFVWFHLICHPIFNDEGVVDNIEGIAMNISKRKEAEEKIIHLNLQIISAARYAGMAEVATSMLHNLGNILNSANVSLTILKENMNQPYLERVLKAISLIKDHSKTIKHYLTEDEKGKLIPEYLVTSSSVLKKEHDIFKSEITNLNVHLNHIKEIVAAQQNISTSVAVIDKVFIPEILDLALQMCASEIKNSIKINREYSDFTQFVEIDKAKLLQILVNLIHNAKDAINENNNIAIKEISIFAHQVENNRIDIKVKDNGIGILSENYTKIFSFGFTTKVHGHGFGLHSSALFAKEIGGNLQVSSPGLNKGSTFTLTIPICQT